MAPSEIPKEASSSSNGDGPSGSRYLSPSAASPSSAPSPPSKDAKEQKRVGTDNGGGGGAEDRPMADSPMGSEEELYSSHHSHTDDHHDGDHDYHSHEDHRKHGDSAEMVESEKQQQQQTRQRQRKPRNRSSAKYSNDNYNGSYVKTVPEVKYAKAAGILSPTNVIMDRGGGGNDMEDSGQVPEDAMFLPQGAINRPNGQYQMHPPGYPNNGNGVNGNGNYNHGNGKNGVYGANGISSPQPNPYNGNGGMRYNPYNHYPQPPQGGPNQIYIYDPNGQYYVTNNNSTSTGLNVRGEEIGIVLVVLLLWVGAIILFFNRWGKIRMLEPYQPKFCENHRPSCPMAEVTAITNIPVCRDRAFSKFNLSTEMLAGPNGSPHFVKCNYHGIPSADPAPGFSGLGTSGLPGGLIIPGAGYPGGGSTGMLNNHRNSIMMMNHHHQHHHHLRPRQNSVFVTSPSSQVSFYGSDSALKSSSRKTKSAVDLPTLVLTGEFVDNVRRNSKSSITQL